MDPLKPYPFPAGMDIPRLMPYQEFPWNNDHHLAAEVLRLKRTHGLKYAFETGTCLGSTALWLAENFDGVWTCEVHQPTYEIACARFAELNGVHAAKDTSDRFYTNIVARRRDSRQATWNDAGRVDFIFLDAHWGEHCPLLDELAAIANPEHAPKGKPCILIHDFQVPGTTFGFDRMPNGTPFHLDLIRVHLDAIYGVGGWKHSYPTAVAGAERGWVSIEPM